MCALAYYGRSQGSTCQVGNSAGPRSIEDPVRQVADLIDYYPGTGWAISAEFTGLWFRRFILGEWVAAEGAVYSMWDPQRHVTTWQDLPVIERFLAVGVDYGTTNATAGLLLGLARQRLWLVLCLSLLLGAADLGFDVIGNMMTFMEECNK